jgi:hypothetical protein
MFGVAGRPTRPSSYTWLATLITESFGEGAMSIGSRCARAAAVGGGLGALWALGWSLGAATVSPSGGTDCSAQSFCVGYGLLVVPALLVAGALAAWPLLYAAGVRPAVLPAVVGPAVVFALYYVVANIQFPSQDGNVPYLVLSALAVLIGYVVAALVTAPELPTRWRVLAIAVVLTAVLVASRMLI